MTISMTSSAVSKVWQLMVQEGDHSLKLRAYISGGGCQGFQYGFAFESEAEHDDFEMSVLVPVVQVPSVVFFQCLAQVLLEPMKECVEDLSRCVSLVVDPISLQYLRGSEVDYLCDGQGERFIVRNPNAKTTCGCHRSFAPDLPS